MKLQDQTTAQASTSNVRTSLAEAMRTATISDETRAYLILIGKLHDLYKEGLEVVRGDIHEVEIDARMKEYCDGLSDAIRHIEYLTSWKLAQSYGMLEFHKHRQL